MSVESISSMSEAIKLKGAIEQTEQRFMPVGGQRSATAGVKSSVSGKGEVQLSLPVMYESGEIFAGSRIDKPGYVPVMADMPNEGTIVEYADENGEPLYSIVTNRTKSTKEGVYVRAANEDYVNQLKKERPFIKHVKLGPKDVLHMFLDVGELAFTAADRREGNLLGNGSFFRESIFDMILYLFVASVIVILVVIILIFL